MNDKAAILCIKVVVTAIRTQMRVLNNIDVNVYAPTIVISSHEEADILVIHYVPELSATSPYADFINQEKIWQIWPTDIATGISNKRRRISLQPIYNKLEKEKAMALPGQASKYPST